MAWFTPFLVPALVGAGTSLIQGRDPLQGALIGGATGGLLNSVDFGGALDTLTGSIPSATNVSARTLGGLNLTGAGFQSALPSVASEAVKQTTQNIIPGSLESAGMVNVDGTYFPKGSIAASGLVENPEISGQYIDPIAYQQLNEPSFMDTVTGTFSDIKPDTYAQLGMMGMQNIGQRQPTIGMQPLPVMPGKEPSSARPLAINIPQRKRRPVFYG